MAQAANRRGRGHRADRGGDTDHQRPGSRAGRSCPTPGHGSHRTSSRGRPRPTAGCRASLGAWRTPWVPHAPGQAPARTKLPGRGGRPLLRLWCRSRRESDQALHSDLGQHLSPFLGAPAALACARMLVPSRKTRLSANPPARSWARPSRRSQTPCCAQRMNNCAARHHGPSSAGIARHLAPLRWR